MGEITTIGVDLAKSVFQLHGVTADGTVALRRQVREARSSRSSAGCRRA
jgi:transposase